MIKYTLIIWVCSFLQQYTCLPPITYADLYDSWYECARAAQKESGKILTKIGYKSVNDGKLATRYSCVVLESV